MIGTFKKKCAFGPASEIHQSAFILGEMTIGMCVRRLAKKYKTLCALLLCAGGDHFFKWWPPVRGLLLKEDTKNSSSPKKFYHLSFPPPPTCYQSVAAKIESSLSSVVFHDKLDFFEKKGSVNFMFQQI